MQWEKKAYREKSRFHRHFELFIEQTAHEGELAPRAIKNNGISGFERESTIEHLGANLTAYDGITQGISQRQYPY